MNDRLFKKLLDALQLSWSGYFKVRKGVKKRILRHMQLLECRHIDQYLQLLAIDLEVRNECRRLLTVSISRLFRDREVWQLIAREMIPELQSRETPVVKVWSAGCARGEEIHSFMILWHAAADRPSTSPRLEAWATDMNPQYLEAAREAVYAASSLREFPTELRDRCLEPVVGRKSRVVLPAVSRGDIHWMLADLLQDDPPAGDFALIFLRNNLLTYYQEALRVAVLDKVQRSLAPGGYLVIGAGERLPAGVHGLSPRFGRSDVFGAEAK